MQTGMAEVTTRGNWADASLTQPHPFFLQTEGARSAGKKGLAVQD